MNKFKLFITNSIYLLYVLYPILGFVLYKDNIIKISSLTLIGTYCSFVLLTIIISKIIMKKENFYDFFETSIIFLIISIAFLIKDYFKLSYLFSLGGIILLLVFSGVYSLYFSKEERESTGTMSGIMILPLFFLFIIGISLIYFF